MNEIYYIGFDVHKKSVSYCAKTVSGEIVREGEIVARREALRAWAAAQSQPWRGAMEATLFSAWIYDTLKPYAQQLDMGHPARMKAITSGKKKSDRLDARTIADLLRCNLLPTCYVLSPQMRDLRRLLRYRHLVVTQSVRMQNKIAGLLMESGAPFVKAKLRGKKYFHELVQALEEVPESVKDLLKMSRGAMELFEATQKQLIRRLLNEPVLQARVERLASIPGVGPITALTWALEIVDPFRFPSIGDADSYCGLTAAFRSSAGKEQRGPLSKQRNAWLQSTLIEAAKLAPRWNSQLAEVHERELKRGHRNRATLQVARKLVAYLMAVDKSGKPFQLRPAPAVETAPPLKKKAKARLRQEVPQLT
jgi:transposase